ncbi:MAG: hypothetical protein ABI432_02105 [Flavobacteriales bacterium]
MNIGNLIDLSDVIGSLIGAFLGFAGAYWLLHLEWDKQLRRADDDAESYFWYVMSLFRSALPGWEKAAQEHLNLAMATKKEWYKAHPHHVSINSSERSLTRVDRYQFREAALLALGSDEGEKRHAELIRFVDGIAESGQFILQAIVGIKGDVNEAERAFDRQCFETMQAMEAHLANAVVKFIPGFASCDQEIEVAFRAIEAVVNRRHNPEIPEMIRTVVLPMVRMDTSTSIKPDSAALISVAANNALKSSQLMKNAAEDLSNRVHEQATAMKKLIDEATTLLEQLDPVH